jgi:GNAT superfamily N-acetyltransferase
LGGADPGLIEAWLAARSIARGLPAPVHDHGGLRVDSDTRAERCRYVFASPCEGLRRLGEAIDVPFVALKLAAPGAELMRLLPPRWALASDNFMMVCDAGWPPARIPDGYGVTLEQDGPVAIATIHDGNGVSAASGRAVEHAGVFIFDQIAVEAAHRRRGLGSALMGALLAARVSPASRLVLTATHEGRALYRRLGWRDYSPWATAMIPPP